MEADAIDSVWRDHASGLRQQAGRGKAGTCMGSVSKSRASKALFLCPNFGLPLRGK